MSKRYWTRDEVKILKSRIKEKYTVVEIAKELSRSIGSVEARITRTKIGQGRNGRPPDIYRWSFILNEIEKGLTLTEISRLLGNKSNSTVTKVVRKLIKQGLVKKTGRTIATRFSVTKEWKGKD